MRASSKWPKPSDAALFSKRDQCRLRSRNLRSRSQLPPVALPPTSHQEARLSAAWADQKRRGKVAKARTNQSRRTRVKPRPGQNLTPVRTSRPAFLYPGVRSDHAILRPTIGNLAKSGNLAVGDFTTHVLFRPPSHVAVPETCTANDPFAMLRPSERVRTWSHLARCAVGSRLDV